MNNYSEFLKQFLQQGYHFVFHDEIHTTSQAIFLRHDIDFDTELALRNGEIEHYLGIQSTYFFALRSEFYNPNTKRNLNNITRLQELGHRISLHFDPLLYEDFEAGLLQESTHFQNLFQVRVQIVSLHRPNPFFQNHDQPIATIEHTYQRKYFKTIKYFSDSTGVWRYGNPLDSDEFRQRRSLHLLTHPVWWMQDGADAKDKLKTHYKNRLQALKSEFSTHCIPFREIEHAL